MKGTIRCWKQNQRLLQSRNAQGVAGYSGQRLMMNLMRLFFLRLAAIKNAILLIGMLL